jgi:hypothetical protein
VFDDGISLVFRSATGAVGETASVTGNNGGIGRDRKIAKTENNDRAITE